jgi:hypothetical protein
MRSGVADTPEREEWKQAVGSTLTHHGPCCDRARAWLIAMGRSYDFSSTDGLALAGPAVDHPAMGVGADPLAGGVVRGGKGGDDRLWRLRRLCPRAVPRQGHRGVSGTAPARVRGGENQPLAPEVGRHPHRLQLDWHARGLSRGERGAYRGRPGARLRSHRGILARAGDAERSPRPSRDSRRDPRAPQVGRPRARQWPVDGHRAGLVDDFPEPGAASRHTTSSPRSARPSSCTTRGWGWPPSSCWPWPLPISRWRA